MSWLFGLLKGLGGLREVIAQLLKAAKHATANARHSKKDDAVDAAIAAASRNPSDQLRDSKAEQQPASD